MSEINTPLDWLCYAKDNEAVLVKFVEKWTPMGTGRTAYAGPITAPGAEFCRQHIAAAIAKEQTGKLPGAALSDAIKQERIDLITTILNRAWFGVPETTSCWNIPGFSEAVCLLENLPEDDHDRPSPEEVS